MNKKEHLRDASTFLQNEKIRKDYNVIPLYRKKAKTKKSKTPSRNSKKPTYLKRS